MASNELTEFQKQKKYTSMMGLCRVCGDKAQYFYYGSLVCLSCKTFFRRYASYTEVCIDLKRYIDLFYV
jgi:hypothetical protein